jgi:DNA-directed RNA polymerase specialized sigma24 family protein
VDGHSAAEIALDLNLSVAAVRQAKYRVLCRLREELAGF